MNQPGWLGESRVFDWCNVLRPERWGRTWYRWFGHDIQKLRLHGRHWKERWRWRCDIFEAVESFLRESREAMKSNGCALVYAALSKSPIGTPIQSIHVRERVLANTNHDGWPRNSGAMSLSRKTTSRVHALRSTRAQQPSSYVLDTEIGYQSDINSCYRGKLCRTSIGLLDIVELKMTLVYRSWSLRYCAGPRSSWGKLWTQQHGKLEYEHGWYRWVPLSLPMSFNHSYLWQDSFLSKFLTMHWKFGA